MSSDRPCTSASIEVRGLSKSYLVYARPQDRLKQSLVPRLQRALGRSPSRFYSEFWALQDVSFDVMRGETIGIIGRNGSGKSTLLQVVCGTLSPTSGRVEVRGRVAALLELGSGFNPEFTGRENVYLNAAVLGLSRQEVEARFSEIEAFADIGGFIDQPVKTYSSGMAVRLAFAVIAHVDAEILVIDEALAVGDAAFTQKCMRFLRAFKKTGTILFVSHDAASIVNLCDRALWLHQGEVRQFRRAAEVSNAYLEFTNQEVYGDALRLRGIAREHAGALLGDASHPGPAGLPAPETETSAHIFSNIAESSGWHSGAATIESVVLLDSDGRRADVVAGGERVELQVTVRAEQALGSPIVGFFLKDRLGQSLFGEHTFLYAPSLATSTGDRLRATFRFVLPLLPNGTYSMTVSIADGEPFDHVQHHWLHEAVIINVSSTKLRYGLVGIPFESVNLVRLPGGDGGDRVDG